MVRKWPYQILTGLWEGTTEDREPAVKNCKQEKRRQHCNQDIGKKGFPMKKLQEEWARRLNGIQWKLLVKDWFDILPGRRPVELWYCFWETMDQQMMIQEPPHFLLKKSWPREKWIEIQSSNLSSGETHTREFTRIFGSVPRHCPPEKTAPFFTTQNWDTHFPKPHILRDKLKLELLTITNTASMRRFPIRVQQ